MDCTKGFKVGNGTELARFNNGCDFGSFADVHLQWLQETQSPLESARDYPLRPDEPAGECGASDDPSGYGPNYYNYIVKRQVRSNKYVLLFIDLIVHFNI